MKYINKWLIRYKWETTLWFVALLTGFTFVKLFLEYDLLTANADSIAKLNISRRFLDSQTPGFSQLGYVWLPVNQLLMVPLIWNDYLWRTGLAGSIVSTLMFSFGAVGIFRLGKIFGGNIAGYTAYSLFVLNPNILYLQATPLTEIFFVSTFVLSVYFAAEWARKRKTLFLVLSSVSLFFCTLSRYEGWIIALLMLFLIFVVEASSERSLVKAKATATIYGFIGFFGVFLWLVWNWAIFKNPLYFAFGEYSAREQQKLLMGQGMLPSYLDISSSFNYFWDAVILNSGYTLAAITVFAFILALKLFINQKRPYFLILLILGIPLIYYPLSLFTGNGVIFVPERFPYLMHNIRYGTTLLPFMAVITGIFISRYRVLGLTVFLAVVLEYGALFYGQKVISLDESLEGFAGRQAYVSQVQEGTDFKYLYSGGDILSDPFKSDPAIFYSSIHLKNWVSRANEDRFHRALSSPEKEVDWVWLREGDGLSTGDLNMESVEKYFTVVYDNKDLVVYKKN